MVMSTESQSSAEVRDTDLAQWKHLVEDGSAAFEKERYAVAEVQFKAALELAEKLKEGEEKSASEIEEDRVRLSKSLNNLAALYHVQGKYGMAEELYEKCLDLKLEMYGEDHLEVAVNLHNLAVLHSAKRTFLKAELLYKRALEIREKLLGSEHPDLVPILKNYGLLLKKTNRKEEAQKFEQRAQEIEAKNKV